MATESVAVSEGIVKLMFSHVLGQMITVCRLYCNCYEVSVATHTCNSLCTAKGVELETVSTERSLACACSC
jgi:hypothetical protein